MEEAEGYCDLVSVEEGPVEAEIVMSMSEMVEQETLCDEQGVVVVLLGQSQSDWRGMVEAVAVVRYLLLSVEVHARLPLVVTPIQGLLEQVLAQIEL